MKQKTILITGATGGIGKAAAIALAAQGHHIIVHGRNAEKTEQTKNELIAAGNSNISSVVADLYSMAEVRKMAATINSTVPQLDILINNAGGLMSKVRETTGEGIEKTFAVNVLAPFLLTNLLLNLLKKSSEARIINIASNSHHLNAQPDFEDLQLQQNYHPLKAYGNSKLFLIWNTQHLATLLQKQQIHQVTAYTLHPGAVATGFGTRSNLGPLLNTLVKLAHPLFKSPEAGADTLIFLATAPVLPGRSGDYFVNRKPVKAAIKYYTAAREQLVWDYCSGITQ